MNTKEILISLVTQYDEKQSHKKSYNMYALSQYFQAIENIDFSNRIEHELKKNFNDRLLTFLLKKLKKHFINNIDIFTKAYIESMLLHSFDVNEKALIKNYDIKDISLEALEIIINDCKKFQNDNKEALLTLGEDEFERVGYCFWVSRNHINNRKGFDSKYWTLFQYLDVIGQSLNKYSKTFPRFELYVDDDNKLYKV